MRYTFEALISVLGRGGSEGCNVPHNIERLNNLGIVQIGNINEFLGEN